jgi:predicted transcriptional regulator YdeE
MQSKTQEYEVKAGLDKVQQFSVAGISTLVTGGQENAVDQINDLWGEFFAQQIGQSLPDRAGETIYAVYSDYQGDYTKPYRLTIGYRMQENAAPSEKFYQVMVQSADYAMMSAQGEQPKALIETWTSIWQSDLPRSYDTDFEVYGPRFFEDGVHEVLVFVGVNMN